MDLKAKCISTVQAKPYKYVTPAILWAVCMQESGGNPLFNKEDKLFKSNLSTAQRITKLDSKKILEIVTLPAKVGNFNVPIELVGKTAKFRLEPGYWNKYVDFDPETRFRISASWGLTQVMGANISRSKDAGLHILHFSANIEWQLSKAADMLDNLLVHSNGNINLMYRGYNSGRINSQDPSVIARANKVEERVHGF